MTKKDLYKEYQTKRKKVRDAIATLKKCKDDANKFKKLIKITSDFEAYVYEVNLNGVKATAHPYGSQKWVDAYYAFTNKPKTKSKTKKKTNEKSNYNIVLCWTIKPDYCVCESIIEKVQKYFASIKMTAFDLTRTEFPDRVEFCERYKLRCTKEHYDLVLSSAEYILDIATDSTYDKCNMGIFGTKL